MEVGVDVAAGHAAGVSTNQVIVYDDAGNKRGYLMLNYLAGATRDSLFREIAERIKAGYNQALTDGQKTRDLGGSLGTSEFAEAVIARMPGE